MRYKKIAAVGAAYCAAAWVLLQLADVLVPALKLPDWLNTLLVVLVVVIGPLSFLGVAAWHLLSENTSKRNRIFDVHIETLGDNRIRISAWYYYDGIVGADDVSIRVAPIRGSTRLPGGSQSSGGDIRVIGHEAKIDMDYLYAPMADSEKSTHLRLCIEHHTKGTIHCTNVRFRYRWVKPALAKQPEQIALQEPTAMQPAFDPVASTLLFGWRMNEVFPSQRGLLIFEGKDALDRLEELLHPPLTGSDGIGYREPFWWFRGGLSSTIESFQRLSDLDFLLGRMEVRMRRIAVWREHDERREFVYVETEGLERTGLYPEHAVHEDEDLAYEPYAIWGEHLITQEEYVDGHARIEGKVVTLEKAESRMRHLVPYNFIVCGKSSPMNSTEFDRISSPILKALLRGEIEVSELVKAGKNLRFHDDREEVW